MVDDFRAQQRLEPILRAGQSRSQLTAVPLRAVGCRSALTESSLERIPHPTVDAKGRRIPALKCGDPRVMALTGALCQTALTGRIAGPAYQFGMPRCRIISPTLATPSVAEPRSTPASRATIG
jgi:hypothetical protein